MVALRGQIVGVNPATGVVGIWFMRTGESSWVGMSKADLQAIPTGGGNAAARRATYLANATAALQGVLGPSYVISIELPASGFDVDNIEVRDA